MIKDLASSEFRTLAKHNLFEIIGKNCYQSHDIIIFKFLNNYI